MLRNWDGICTTRWATSIWPEMTRTQIVQHCPKTAPFQIDMAIEGDIRWPHANYPTLPKRKYLIDGLEKFDASMFKTHAKQADVMDPQCRILLELANSAILDAGVHPSTLRKSRTGVFTANCYNDAILPVLLDSNPADGYKLTG